MIGNDWDLILKEEYKKTYFLQLKHLITNEYKNKQIFPPFPNIFYAFKLTPYHQVKVVIIGQDPYHNEGEAYGLAFSVGNKVKMPPSLRNIFKELKSDLGIERVNCELEDWAAQGVFLINAILTVEKNKPNSHKGLGWETFTDQVITLLNKRNKPIVFLLWGNNAKQKSKLINNKNHLVLTAAHPSPLSYFNGFEGCKHFSKANNFLIKTKQEPIEW